MEGPISGAEVYGRAVEPLRLTALAISKSYRPCYDLWAVQPSLQERRRNVKKYALTELLDGGKPFDATGKIGPIHSELNFVEFAFCRSRWRLQTREGV